MQVKIGDLMFDSEDTPIMVVLDDDELKEVPKLLESGQNVLASYPDNITPEQIEEWVKKTPTNLNDGTLAVIPMSIAIEQLTNRIITIESAIANLIKLS
jgi:hypothetical protein